ETHVHTLTIAGNLGSQLREAGELDEAIELHSSITRALVADFGPQSREAMVWRLHWAEDLARTGDHEAAERMMQEEPRLRLPRRGAAHRDTMGTAMALAELYRKRGRHDRAIELLRDFLPEAEKLDRDDTTLSVALTLADSAAALNRHTERRRWIAEARKVDPQL